MKASRFPRTTVAIMAACVALSPALTRADEYEAVQVWKKARFFRPLYLTHAPGHGGVVFIVEKDGRILAIPRTPSAKEPREFLNIKDRVSTAGNEEGLLGLAFPPDYQSSRRFYVYYSASKPRRSVLSRFSAQGLTADPHSEKVILTVPQPYSNHNGGMITFGPDGMLYVGLGDGGYAGDPHDNGQDTRTLLGGILRIDPRKGNPYAIPPDNPFAQHGKGVKGEIWAYGLRNPWRFSFDRATGDLWCGDVGQNSYEEIDVIVKGGNYGWNVFEGAHEFENPNNIPASEFIGPIIEYGRDDGISVTGGYVYRGQKLPGLAGKYIYGDFGTGNIWALDYDVKTRTFRGNRKIATAPLIASFGEDQDGEIYIVSLQGSIWTLKKK